MNRSRSISVTELVNTKFKTLDLTGEWLKVFGVPEANGVWLIYGHSGHGKSRFMMQLAKMLTQFGKVIYNDIEEGARLTFQSNIIDTHIFDDPVAKKNLIILDKEPLEQLVIRLNKKKAPRIVILNSIQHAQLQKRDYLKLKDNHPNVLFILNSHAQGAEPQGALAKFIKYDADIKIKVEGFKAFPASRYGGGEPYTIWEDGAAKYWADIS
jgi:energy-coupling factor transporter ATP-binding protein EcfA2